jgi:hypothetical protein
LRDDPAGSDSMFFVQVRAGSCRTGFLGLMDFFNRAKGGERTELFAILEADFRTVRLVSTNLTGAVTPDANTMTDDTTTATTPLSAVLAEFMPELAEMEEQQAANHTLPDPPEESETEEEEESEDTESTETDEEESEDGEEDETEPEQPKSKDWPESARKRVDKLTAKLREAEAKAQELEAKVGNKPEPTQRTEAAPATSGSILEEVWDTDTLMAKTQSALAWKQWAIENPEGGLLKLGDSEKEYTEEDVKRILVNSDRLLNVDIPKRRDFLGKAAQYENGLRTEFPDFFKPDSETWKGIVGAFSEIPSLKARPDGIGLAIMMSLGLQEFAKLKGGKKAASTVATKPKAKTALAPRPVEPAAAASAPGPKSGRTAKRSKSLDDIISQGGDVDALETFFTS